MTATVSEARPANGALTWFRRVVLLGVAANFAVGITCMLAPVMVIDLLHLEPATPLLWPRFSAFLLMLMSVFYIPGALDPTGKRFEAWWTVGCRAGGVIFFAIVGGPYIVFGLFDLVFGLPQAILLWRGLAAAKR